MSEYTAESAVEALTPNDLFEGGISVQESVAAGFIVEANLVDAGFLQAYQVQATLSDGSRRDVNIRTTPTNTFKAEQFALDRIRRQIAETGLEIETMYLGRFGVDDQLLVAKTLRQKAHNMDSGWPAQEGIETAF